MNVNCDFCGKTFQKSETEIKRTKHSFCSIICTCAMWKKTRLSLGEKNGRWKGGNSHQYQATIYRPIADTLEQKCSLCGVTSKLVAHHIDGNYKNNVLGNLTIVCRGCHNKLHKSKRCFI